MSLDLYLITPDNCPHCGKPLRVGAEVWWRNITHNVTNMWSKAHVYDALYESDGKKAGEFVEALRDGLTDMVEHFQDYKKLDAANGWGKAEHAIAFLWAAYRAFSANPDATIRVSR